MHHLLETLWAAVTLSAGMVWHVAWSLILGFVLSGVIQSVASQERMRSALGRDGVREIALATALGAISSSCSYASAAVTRTLFRRGAALVPALAFLFASTNLVIELGIILYVLLGWQFLAAEWTGGIVLIVVMAILVRATYPKTLVETARRFGDGKSGHRHGGMLVEGATVWQRLRNPELPVRVAQAVSMDVSMLWKDLAIGFVIAGVLGAFVPAHWWATLFLKGSSPWLQRPVDALIGPLVAVVSFVCSIGNVPLAAVLWSSGISFGGVLSFLFADLIVLPLLDVYRRQYGWRMAAYIAVVFYATMVLSGLLVELAFHAIGIVPATTHDVRAGLTQFSLNYTFWLNLLFGALAVWLTVLARRHPMHHDMPEDGDHAT